MLRPATPLTLLLFVAFVLLLLSVISTPIVNGIPLASFRGVDFGVFGYCKQGSDCPGIQVGYSMLACSSHSDNRPRADEQGGRMDVTRPQWCTGFERTIGCYQTVFIYADYARNLDADQIFNSNEDENFSLPASARSSLSSILIVHPVAAFLTLICFILAASAHLHSPSHSPRYLLALLILLLPTLLITLLAFLVDILLFVPHLAWGGWIVLASTVLITASGVVTCAMRRTLVSRKARKKRIAQNAEMNGENHYARQTAIEEDSLPPPNIHSPRPMVNGGTTGDQLPAFTTYDSKSQGITDDERVPLNTRTLSNRTVPSNGTRPETSEDGSEKYGGIGRGAPGGMRGGGHGGQFNGPRDEFGNLLPPSNAFGPVPQGGFRREPSDHRMTHQYSNETMDSQQSRGRGRGGYPGRGYGRGGPFGPGRGPGFNGNGRGIPLGPLAAAADGGMIANEMGNRRQGAAPPGYGNGYRPDGRGTPGQYNGDIASGPGGAAMYARDQSSSRYSGSPSPGPPSGAVGYGRQPPPIIPPAPGGYVRSNPPSPHGNTSPYGRRPSPGPPSMPGAHGYVARESSPGPGAHPYQAASPPPPLPELQTGEGQIIGQAVEMDAITGNTPTPTRVATGRDSDGNAPGLAGVHMHNQHRGSPLSMTSVYSAQEPYVPPRAAWAAATARSGTPPQNFARPLSPIHASPVELPTPQNVGNAPLPMHTFSHSPPPDPDTLPSGLPTTGVSSSHVRMKSSDNYYEDVDPRFTDPAPPPHSVAQIPRSLTPGGAKPSRHPRDLSPQPPNFHPSRTARLETSTSYESMPDGARTPSTSDASNFTSISQRGINPNWRSPPPAGASGMGTGGVPNRRPIQHQQQQPTDVLQANPDFEIPRGARR